MTRNPFDEFDIPPSATVDEITELFRDRIDQASEQERAILRAAWEELTLHPKHRLVSALLTFPEPATLRTPQASWQLPLQPMPAFELPRVTLLSHLPRPKVRKSTIPTPNEDTFFLAGDPPPVQGKRK